VSDDALRAWLTTTESAPGRSAGLSRLPDTSHRLCVVTTACVRRPPPIKRHCREDNRARRSFSCSPAAFSIAPLSSLLVTNYRDDVSRAGEAMSWQHTHDAGLLCCTVSVRRSVVIRAKKSDNTVVMSSGDVSSFSLPVNISLPVRFAVDSVASCCAGTNSGLITCLSHNTCVTAESYISQTEFSLETSNGTPLEVSKLINEGVRVIEIKPSNCFRLHSTSMISKRSAIPVHDSL